MQTDSPRSPSGRRYDAEFKDNAVSLVLAGRSLRAVARDLGCSSWSLQNWLKAHKMGQQQSQSQSIAAETPQQRELRRLRLENQDLRLQRDILKKALSIVSTEHPQGGLR